MPLPTPTSTCVVGVPSVKNVTNPWGNVEVANAVAAPIAVSDSAPTAFVMLKLLAVPANEEPSLKVVNAVTAPLEFV